MSTEVKTEDAASRIQQEAAAAMRKAIEEAGGVEVYFAGSVGADGKIEDVRVVARGDYSAVPAIAAALRSYEVMIHNHPSGNLTPSRADLAIAACLGNEGHGAFIVDNDVSRIYVVVEPFVPPRRADINIQKVLDCFRAGGALAKTLSEFEVRASQQRICETVLNAFLDEHIAVIEAPTGVGKTLAYLVPAIEWAVSQGERVVISSRTLNLQEQLVEQAIPHVCRALGYDVKVAVVKGKGNYLCLRKLREIQDADLGRGFLMYDEVPPSTQQQLNLILEAVKTMQRGDLAELSFVPLSDVRERVTCDPDLCNLTRCPDPTRCFVGKARREAFRAQVLVVNHSVLFADIALKRAREAETASGILPTYSRLIIDEAHEIEDAATAFFGSEVHRAGSLALLARLYSESRGRPKGLIPSLADRLLFLRNASPGNEARLEVLLTALQTQVTPALLQAREQLINLFDALEIFLDEQNLQGLNDFTLRLSEPVLTKLTERGIPREYVKPTAEAVENLLTLMHSAWQRLDELTAYLERNAGKNTDASSRIKQQIEDAHALGVGYLNRITSMRAVLLECFASDDVPNRVRWLRLDRSSGGNVYLASYPISVDRELADVYQDLKTVVLTSATLTVDGSFRFFAERVGLQHVSPQRVHTRQEDSPFDMQKQALLCAVTDVPEPTQPKYTAAMVQAIEELVGATGGGTLVLFTSYETLKECVSGLRHPLETRGYTVLVQAERPREVLTREFRGCRNGVLFGTDSFWTGVDVPGEALRSVLITRLPFRVPTEPLQEARAEAVRMRGGNEFRDFSLPQAILKFKQGFGRLIRRATDRGVVVVLDRRIVTKPYGRQFLEAVPGARFAEGTTAEISKKIREFFENAP